MLKRKSHRETCGKSCASNPALFQLARPSPTQQRNEKGRGWVGGGRQLKGNLLYTVEFRLAPGSLPLLLQSAKKMMGFRVEGNPLYTVDFLLPPPLPFLSQTSVVEKGLPPFLPLLSKEAFHAWFSHVSTTPPLDLGSLALPQNGKEHTHVGEKKSCSQ